MTGAEFARMIVDGLESELAALGFASDGPTIHGKEYSATFTAPQFRLLVSYEPGDDWLATYVLRRVGSGWSEIDDRQQTPRLDDLNRRYSKRLNDTERDRRPIEPSVDDPAARRLARALAQIPLVLPAYMEEVRKGTYSPTR
jgi:hypothetical protein